MDLHALLAQPSRITVAVQGGQTVVQATKGDYQFTIDSGTARLIISPGLSAPTNLRVTSGAPGSDIAFEWDAGVGAVSYIVQIHDNLGQRREFTTTALSAVYLATQAVSDGGHKRTYTVKIASFNSSVGRSDYAEMVIENSAPATPITNITPQSGGFVFNIENALEADYAGMIVWAHTAAGVPMDDDHKVYDGYSQTAVIAWAASSTAYFRVARYDSFGKTDLNVSSELSATKTAVAGLVQTDTLPGTTYLGDDVVFYTVGEEFYQWNQDALPDPTYERAAPNILNGQLYAIDLKAISASVGELKLGQMLLDTFGHIRGGQTAYDTGAGFWLGYDGGTYKLSFGDSSGNKLTYASGNLTFSGALSAASGTLGTLTIGTGGYVQSSNYSAGTAGWKLSETVFEFNTGKFTVASDGTVSIKSASSGARLEIYNNVIKVYDSAGTLRVKLGDLSA